MLCHLGMSLVLSHKCHHFHQTRMAVKGGGHRMQTAGSGGHSGEVRKNLKFQQLPGCHSHLLRSMTCASQTSSASPDKDGMRGRLSADRGAGGWMGKAGMSREH